MRVKKSERVKLNFEREEQPREEILFVYKLSKNS
jgi:hypothetical protein